MTGIAVGAAALTGVVLGWWSVLAIAAVASFALAMRANGEFGARCLLIFLVAAIGAWRGGDRTEPLAANVVPGNASSWTVLNAPARTGQRQYFVAASIDHERPEARRGSVRTCVTARAFPAVHLDDVVRLTGESRAAVDVSPSQRAALAARGCDATLFAESQEILDSRPSLGRVVAELRSRIGISLRSSAPGDAGVLLTGLVTGDDAGFSPGRRAAFLASGATHLTAVSGSNLALVAAILTTAGTVTLGRHRRLFGVGIVSGIWGYAMLTGMYVPTVRAAIVASAAILAFHFGRRADFPTLILLAAGIMVLLDPNYIDALGFRLSVAASLALAIVLHGMIDRDRASRPALIVGATTAAQIATLPFLLTTFGTVSITSLPANIVVAPLAAFAMPIAALAGVAGLVWPPLGEAIAAPATLAAAALIGAVDFFGASGGYLSVGVPPLGATIILGATGALLLVLMSGDVMRMMNRGRLRRDPPLSTAALLVLARKDPLDTLRADANQAEKHPPRQEEGHDVANVGNLGQTLP